MNIAKYAVLIGGGMIAGRKLFNGYQWMRGNIFTGGKAGGGLPGGGGGMPIPVYVVNKHLSLMPGEWGGKGGSGLPGGAPAAITATRAAAFILPAIPAVAAATVGYFSRATGKALAENELKVSSSSRLREILSRQMVMGGGPNSYQAKLIVAELEKRGASNPFKGELNIKIDSETAGRVQALNSNNSGMKLNVDTGLMMRSH